MPVLPSKNITVVFLLFLYPISSPAILVNIVRAPIKIVQDSRCLKSVRLVSIELFVETASAPNTGAQPQCMRELQECVAVSGCILTILLESRCSL
jgi:hypothetical protein